MHILVDLMREASKRTQLVIATHSDRFDDLWTMGCLKSGNCDPR